MSKVPLRARALDAAKPMPVYSPDQLPDLADYAACNRTISALPTGVDKEEEMELHLQQALSAQQAHSTGQDVAESAFIPVPEVADCPQVYDALYTPDYAPPKLLIKVQAALNLEPEIPDYDLDKADEEFLAKLRVSEIDISELQFETVMDRLEKNTDHTVTTFDEARALLTDFDDDIISSVYDYWLGKRVEARQALIPRVKTERRDGATGLNPYVAFRRRAERMQTRKNRKNDEDSYEKILRLSQDLRKAVTLLEMVKRREKTKREMVNLDVEVLERRYSLEDWDSILYSGILRESKPSHSFSFGVPREPKAPRPKKAKRSKVVAEGVSDAGLVSREWLQQNLDEWNRPWTVPGSPARHKRKPQAQTDPDGNYTFRRILGCVYYAPATMGEIKRPSAASRLQPHPVPLESDAEKRRRDHSYEARQTPAPTDKLHHLFLRSFTGGLRHIGQARARRGRGGRLIFDRSLHPAPASSWLPPSSTSPSPSALPHSTGPPPPHTPASPPPFFRPRSPSPTSSSPSPPSSHSPYPHYSCSSLKHPPPAWNPIAALPPDHSDSEDLDGSEDSPVVLVERGGTVRPHRVRVGVTPSTYGSHRTQLHLQKLEPRLCPPSLCPDPAPPPSPLSKEAACLSTSAVMSFQSVMKLVSQREPFLNNNKMDVDEDKGPSRSWNGDSGMEGARNGTWVKEPGLEGPSSAVLQLSYPSQTHPLPTPSPSPTHSGSQDGHQLDVPAAMKSEASVERRQGNQASPSLAISPPESITPATISASTNGDMEPKSFHQIQRPIVR